MLCSVVKHLGSGRVLKRWGKTLDCVSCFPLHFFRALPLPACFTTEQSTVEASLFVNYGKFNIRFQGPSVWNTIDDNVKVSSSTLVSKKRLNDHILKDIRGYLLFFLTFFSFFFVPCYQSREFLITISMPYTFCVVVCLSIVCANLN